MEFFASEEHRQVCLILLPRFMRNIHADANVWSYLLTAAHQGGKRIHNLGRRLLIALIHDRLKSGSFKYSVIGMRAIVDAHGMYYKHSYILNFMHLLCNHNKIHRM